MTPDAVRQRVAAIEAVASDDEQAHGLEDELYRELLEAIANDTCQEPRLCAAIALRTQLVQFARWGA